VKRTTALTAGLAAVVGVAGGGAFAGRQIRSPAEIAARTAAPAPSPITVPVEQLILSSEVTTRGTVHYGAPQAVALPTSALKSAKSGGTAVVTALPAPATQIAEARRRSPSPAAPCSSSKVPFRPIATWSSGQAATTCVSSRRASPGSGSTRGWSTGCTTE